MGKKFKCVHKETGRAKPVERKREIIHTYIYKYRERERLAVMIFCSV